MAFRDAISRVGYANNGAEYATGVFPALFRTTNHIFAALAQTDVSEARFISTNRQLALDEINEAVAHIALVPRERFSRTTQARFANLVEAIEDVQAELPEWDKGTSIGNLVSLINAVAMIGTVLDREIFGLRSDAGVRM